MNVMMMSMVLWSPDAFGITSFGTVSAKVWIQLFAWASFFGTAIVMVLLAPSMAAYALDELLERRLSAELLLVVGAAAAMAVSCWNMLLGEHRVYFEVACAIALASTIGKWLQASARQQAVDALKARGDWIPSESLVLLNEQWESIPTEEVKCGAFVRVSPGRRIPLDGEVTSGKAFVDEQLLTGESLPLAKSPGDNVYGGSLNIDGDLVIRVAKQLDEGVFARIRNLVEQALSQRGRWQRRVDRVTQWFLPTIAVFAAFTVYYHAAWGGASWETGMLHGLTVVLIACPCALGLATPLAVWSALAGGAREGIVVGNSDALGRLSNVDALFVDKTGTLTSSVCQVERIEWAPDVDQAFATRAAALLAMQSQHPLSRALAAHFAVPKGASSQMRVHPGAGIEGIISEKDDFANRSVVLPSLPLDGTRVLLGSEAFLISQGTQIPIWRTGPDSELARATSPTCALAWDGQVQAVFHFCETFRDESDAFIQKCKESKIEVTLLTGDVSADAAALQRKLNIPVFVGVSPEEKLRIVAASVSQGRRTAMVGDGVNDAPALAAVDIGIAMGCGGDLSRQTAGICLMNDDLLGVLRAREWGKAMERTIVVNLIWACVYNVVGVALAMAGCLTPLLAAPAMLLSSVFVVRNSLSLPNRVNTIDTRQVYKQSPKKADPSKDVSLRNSLGRESIPSALVKTC